MRGSRFAGALLVAAALLGGAAARAEVTLYHSTGFVDSQTMATSVNCSNLGPGESDLIVRFYGPGGSLACQVTYTNLAAGATATISTRATGLYVDTAFCATAPAVAGGSLEIQVDDASAERLACAVRLLAASGTQPAFAEKLPLFNRSWVPIRLVIFEGGFEAGSTIGWSIAVP
jgi:hypothetical protein